MSTTEYGMVDYFDYKYSDGTPMRVSNRTMQMLTRMVAILHYNDHLTMLQGSRHTGVQQSAQTHWGDGVVDLAANDWENKCNAAMAAGFMPFHREAVAGLWGEHIHMVDAGSTQLNYQAAAQRVDWSKHLNGLVGHARYTGPWHRVAPWVFQIGTFPNIHSARLLLMESRRLHPWMGKALTPAIVTLTTFLNGRAKK